MWGCTRGTNSPQKKHFSSQNYPLSTQSPYDASSIVGISITDTQSECPIYGGTVAGSVKQTAQTPQSTSAPHANTRSMFDFYTPFMLRAHMYIGAPKSPGAQILRCRFKNFQFGARQPRPVRVRWNHHQLGARLARPDPEGEHHGHQLQRYRRTSRSCPRGRHHSR